MATVNGLIIDDGQQYVVTEVTYRSAPQRSVNTAPIARRPGDKLTAIEWSRKEINIKGAVFSTTTSGLRGLVDALQQNFAVKSLTLAIDIDRSYTANLTKMDIPTQFFNNSYVEYDATFLAVDPFAYARQITASGMVISGTLTFSGTLTVSGTVFTEPTLTLTPTGANAGNSNMSAIKITHIPSGETMTISGVLSYNSPIVIDYNNFLVTVSGINSDYTGIFSRWEPGINQFTIGVISGVNNAFNYTFAYQPRYYQ